MKTLRYIYTVIDTKGRMRFGFVKSNDIHMAHQYLLQKQWMVLELKVVEQENNLENKFQFRLTILAYTKQWINRLQLLFPFSRCRKLSSKRLLYFTQKLSNLFKSGLPLSLSLRIMFDQEQSLYFKKILEDIIRLINEGASFADTLMVSKANWSNYYIYAIQAADRSGRLEMVIDMLQMELGGKVEFENKLNSALVYPIFVLVLSILVMITLLIFVVPKFSSMLNYLSPATDFPLGTRLILSLSQFVCRFWWLLLCLLPVIGLMYSSGFKTNLVQLLRDKLFQRLPFIGKSLCLIEIEQMLYTLHILTASGVHLIEALGYVQTRPSNLSLRNALLHAYQRILEGIELSEALGSEKVFPAWLKDNLKMGEQAGALEDTFKKSAYLIRTEIERNLKLITTFTEPLLVLGLAVFIGGLVICLFWPILMVIQQMSEF